MNTKDKQLLEEAYQQVNEFSLKDTFKKVGNIAGDALGALGQTAPGPLGAMSQIGSNVLKGQNVGDAIKSGVTQSAMKDLNMATMASQFIAPQFTPLLAGLSQALSKNDTSGIKQNITDLVNKADPNTLKAIAGMLTQQTAQ